jgi:hypothetical protein
MTDIETLHHLVFQQTTTSRQALSKLGYFCTPFRPDSDPFRDKVIKVYQPQRDEEILQALVAAHDDYVNLLRKLGVCVPETNINLLSHGAMLVPVIVQEAIETKFMMRSQMLDADLDGCRGQSNFAVLERLITRGWTCRVPPFN